MTPASYMRVPANSLSTTPTRASQGTQLEEDPESADCDCIHVKTKCKSFCFETTILQNPRWVGQLSKAFRAPIAIG